MKSALRQTIFWKVPSVYHKDTNCFKVDEDIPGMNLICCGVYVNLATLMKSCYTLNNGGCYR